MPIFYKFLISLLVVVFAGGAHVFRESIGMGASALQLGALTTMMVVGLWMFPEPKKEPKKR